MPASRIHVVLLTVAIAGGAALPWGVSSCGGERTVEVGFWFERIVFDAPRLGGALTASDLDLIAVIAREELTRAFEGLRVTISDRRDASYRVRVVQQVRDARLRRVAHVAGESRAVAGFGGSGAVNFEMLASSAQAYAPPEAGRPALLAAIGRGVGRTAIHELTHQLLPQAPIHQSTDMASYEYASAARREQYYGDMRWSLAWPLLEQRLGSPRPTAR